MNLYQIIYQSQSLVPFETPELLALLAHSRVNNQRRNISGILLYTPDGRFLQVLEGEQEAVQTLYYQRIALDPRHYSCRVLGEGPCPQRSFADWHMGFREAQAHHLRTLLGAMPPGNPPDSLVPRPHNRSELLELLLEFVASGETQPWLEHPH